MYINTLNNLVPDKVGMEKFLNFWTKEGFSIPYFFEEMMAFEKPILFRARHLATARNEDFRFAQIAEKYNCIPAWNEYLDDKFVSFSAPKLSLLYPKDKNGQRLKLTNPNKWEYKKLSEIVLSDGKTLVEFHHNLWDDISTEKYKYDFSSWLQQFGSAKDYYFADLSMHIAFGVLLADFHSGPNPLSSKTSADFTKKIVELAFKEVKKVFGVQPKIYQFKYQKGDELYPKLSKEV